MRNTGSSGPSTDPLSRLPHRGPARLPETLLALDPGTRVLAERRLRPGDACLNQQGLLPATLLVELMAQVGGLLIEPREPREPGEPRAPRDGDTRGDGALLAGVRRMHLHGTAGAGETVTVECELSRRMGDVFLIECRSDSAGRPLAHGAIHLRRLAGGGA